MYAHVVVPDIRNFNRVLIPGFQYQMYDKAIKKV